MDRQPKILQVVNGFGIGGGELKLLELAERLDKAGYNQVIVSVGQGGPLEEKFRALGCPVYVLPKKWSFDFTLPIKLAKILKHHKIDLMMSTLFYADIIAAAATLFYKPAVFLSWEVITGKLSWYQKLAYKIFASRFDRVVAVSNSIHPFIVRDRGIADEKITTIHYGVDLEKFKLRTRRSHQGVVFGTVARLVHQKGHTHLLDAIVQVSKEYPEARWVFVGDGDKRIQLENKARQLGISSVVEFAGNSDDIPSELAKFDVFVLPSLWEGFPNVLLEAMAAGLPVIATAVEGTVELVAHNKTGLLVLKEDPAALADAMTRLLKHPEMLSEMGEAGRKRVETQFSVEKQVIRFQHLYDELLQK